MVEVSVPVIDERVAFIEGRVTEFSLGIDGLRQQVAAAEQRMDQRFAAIDQRFAAIDDKMSRQFYRIIGVQMTTFVVTIATILAALFGR